MQAGRHLDRGATAAPGTLPSVRRAIVAVAILAGAVAAVPHAVRTPSIQRSPSLGHTKSIPWSEFYPSESSSESSCLLDPQVSASSRISGFRR